MDSCKKRQNNVVYVYSTNIPNGRKNRKIETNRDQDYYSVRSINNKQVAKESKPVTRINKMAAFLNVGTLTLILAVNFSFISGQFLNYRSYINYITIEDCNVAGNTTKQFYDVTKLACVPCSQDDTFQTNSADGKPRHVSE